LALGDISATELIGQKRELYIAIFTGISDVGAGLVASLILIFVKGLPWILSILPPLLTIRGVLSGILSGVLTTSLHIGMIKDGFRGNTDDYYGLISAIFLASFLQSFLIAIILGASHASFSVFIDILLVVNACFFIATAFSVFLTSNVAFLAFRRGVDPDVVVYPIMSTVNDILINLFVLATIILLNPLNRGQFILRGSLLFVFIAIFNLMLVVKNRHTTFFKKVLRESNFGLIYALILSSIAGILLDKMTPVLKMYPALLIAWPAMLTTVGDAGSITSSILTTKLHIGELKPELMDTFFVYGTVMMRVILPPFTLALVIYLFISDLLTFTFSTDSIVFLFTVVPLSAYISFLMIQILSVAVAIISYEKGLDPDNVSIPIVTSSSDCISTLILFIIINMLY